MKKLLAAILAAVMIFTLTATALAEGEVFLWDNFDERDPNAKPEPEVIKETDQKRLTQVKMMRVAIGVLAVLSVAMLAWIIWRSADLLM